MTKQKYIVLANKYRPQDFSDLIGQEALVRTLTNAIKTGRIANAFVLTGIRGVGKTTTARIIARALNCIGEDGQGGATTEPCGKCNSCISIKEGRHPDVMEMDAASRTGVDDVREIIENSRYLPNSARYKIYIIDEVHMLSKNAFNALLKTLEEPPERVKFIFATTEIRKIPVTILSRCQRFDLRRIDGEVLVNHLANIAQKEGAEVDRDALVMVANAAEGSVRDSLSLLDQLIAHSDGKVTVENARDMLGLADSGQLIEIFESIALGSVNKALEIFKDLYSKGADPLLTLQDLLEFTYLVTKAKVSPELKGGADVPELEFNKAKELAANLSIAYLTRCWQMLLKGLGEVKMASNSFSAGEMILIRMAYAAELPPPASLIRDISGQGGAAAPSNAPVRQPSYAASGASAIAVSAAPAIEPAINQQAEPVAYINNFNDLVGIFKQKKEVLLYSWLINDVSLVKFEQGRLELNLSPDVPANFVGRINQCLNDWTGKRWMITVSAAKGEATLKEKIQEEATNLRKKIEEHPDIQKILETFPGAYIK